MKILYLHGWQSVSGGVKPTFLRDHGHTVIEPELDHDDFEAAVRTAQIEYDRHVPDVVVGSSRGGAVAMNIDSRNTPLVLLCPAWKKWGTAHTVKSPCTVLHSRRDDVVPFVHSEQLIANSGLPTTTLCEVGNDHRLADTEPLAAMLDACGTLYSMSLMFSFYQGLYRKGPGSESSTRQALELLGELPSAARVVDFGCGAGAASMVLARTLDCHITAIDIHQPFLEELKEHAGRNGLTSQIETFQADMADPPFPDGSVDLVWSEGAIYNIGFEQGLKRWRRLLRDGGCIAVTELTWISDTPSQQAIEFWREEYPAMSTIEQNLATMQSAGYKVAGHFILPADDWRTFYEPLEQRISLFHEQHRENPIARTIIESHRRELAMWKQYGDSYGYVFYLGRAK